MTRRAVRASRSRFRFVLKTRLPGRVFRIGVAGFVRGAWFSCFVVGASCFAGLACHDRAGSEPRSTKHEARSTTHEARLAQRVITLAPNLTEIVFAIGAGDRLVATDDFSDSPPAAKRLPKVGGVEPNVERILAAKPDLVLASASANTAPLQKAKLPLDVVRTDRVDDIPRAMEHIGSELAAPHTAEAVHALRDAMAKQRRQRAHAPRILFVAWTQPLYVGGRETFIDDLYGICGAQNAVEVRGWPQYALESVVAAPPDIILHSSRLDIEPLLRAAPELRAKCRIVPIDENRFTRPGPHMADAARDLNGIIGGR
jgi:ABC-type hemin transport system substrate-binding protein